eukprot:11809943-Karenia_brevis.AAC.1
MSVSANDTMYETSGFAEPVINSECTVVYLRAFGDVSCWADEQDDTAYAGRATRPLHRMQTGEPLSANRTAGSH